MITLIEPGARALVVDLGRPGHRHLGVPMSGAADRLCHQIANWIVGNAPDAATVECALGGLRVRADHDVTVAVCGASVDADIDGRAAQMWTVLCLQAGETLSLSPSVAGARTYLSVAGGLAGDMHFGSRSTYPPARLGANGGRALAKGDVLTLADAPEAPNALPFGYRPRLSNHVTLRVRSVGEYEELSADAQRRLFVRPWTASRQTSRMGARLEGGTLALHTPRSLVSSPLLPGTVQVPPDGQPILSLVDAHCTGGYPRAVQVVAPDMWLAGQIGPGTRISFARAFADTTPATLDAHLRHWRGIMPDYVL